MAKPVEQTPRERLIAGNERVKAPSGKTTWKIKADRNRPAVAVRSRL